jgi:DNA adenine methylase
LERRGSARADGPRPFIKWAGGKTQLLTQFEPLFPARGSIRRYIEPFVGSAAVFFRVRKLLEPRDVILADSNAELVNVYRAVRDDVEGLIRRLARHKRAHSEAHYYRVRAQNPTRLSPTARAARLIYLNKTCFNGLYRVNRSGQFNVPIGRQVNPPILDAGRLRDAADALGGVTLKVAHFARTLEYARKGDFIYFDPPYQPISSTSSFTAYTDGAFREEDQRELASVYTRLARRGCLLMLSNSDSPLVRTFYRGFDIRKVRARRAINSRADRRGRIAEVVVLDYEPGLRPPPRRRLSPA